MPEPDVSELLRGITPNDIQLDPQGRVVVSNPAIAEQLKAAGQLSAARAKGDTNFICCGNKSCLAAEELGSLVERFVGGPG